MWICNRPFRYRGVSYRPGDQVPAESWPGRKALSSIRKIKYVAETGSPEETAAETKPLDITKLKRAELNAYATEQGVEDAEGYSSRETLIEKLNSLNAPSADTETGTTVETEVQLPEGNESDSLWSDDTDESDTLSPDTEDSDTGK